MFSTWIVVNRDVLTDKAPSVTIQSWSPPAPDQGRVQSETAGRSAPESFPMLLNSVGNILMNFLYILHVLRYRYIYTLVNTSKER